MVQKATTSEQQSVRVLKVGERVRHILSELLARGEVHDDVLNSHSVSVTEVRMSPDLRHATAFIKPLLGVNEAVVLKALRTNTAFFQKEVAARVMRIRIRVEHVADAELADQRTVEWPSKPSRKISSCCWHKLWRSSHSSAGYDVVYVEFKRSSPQFRRQFVYGRAGHCRGRQQ